MKNSIFIIRFGLPSIHDIDRTTIEQATDGNLDNASSTPCPIGVVSLVMTKYSPEDIANLYRSTAGEFGHEVAVAVWPLNSPDVRAILPFDKLEALVDDFRKQHNLDENADPIVDKCILSLDELLDKISREGKSSLTELEFSRLNFLSNSN